MKNAVILFDRIMYDHLSGDWRSSWSMFKRYLKRYDERKTNRGMFSNDEWEHVSTKKWLALLDNALDNGTIAGKKYADSKDVNKRISTLLVYTQMIQSESTAWIYGSKSYQIDHIIPKKKIMDKGRAGNEFMKDNVSNVFNLCVLSDETNNKKRAKSLKTAMTVMNGGQITEIEKAVWFKRTTLNAYDTVSNELMKKLCRTRKTKLRSIFSSDNGHIHRRTKYLDE